MIPCSKRDWQAYMGQHLPDDISQEYEQHLYTCDACLQLFMEALEASKQLAEVELTKEKTHHIMAVIPSENREPESRTLPHVVIIPKRKADPWIRKPLFQYGIAAIITLILMSAGVFQSLSLRMSHIESVSNKKQQESFSQKLMEKTVAMLDAVQAQPKGGKNP